MPPKKWKKLIKLVEKRPELWNRDLKNSNNREFKKHLWNEVASELNTTIATVKSKWRNLREQFRQEYNRKASRTKTTEWAYFGNLLFIKDHIIMQNGKRLSVHKKIVIDENAASSEDDLAMSHESSDNTRALPHIASHIEEIFLEDDSLTRATLPSQAEPSFNSLDNPPAESQPTKGFVLKRNIGNGETPPRSTGKRKMLERLVELEESKLQHFKESSSSSSFFCAQSQSDDYHFVVSLVPYLEKLPWHRKMFVRTKIQQIFCEEYDAMMAGQMESGESL